MSDDPWGNTPDPWAPQESVPPPPEVVASAYTSDQKERPVSGDNDKISVTLKGGTGYDAPWIVVKGVSVEDALATLNEIREKGLMDIAAKAAGMFQGFVGGGRQQAGPPQGGGGYQQRAPQQAGPPPNVQAQTCKHGPMVYKSGMNKFNKPYQAFFCPAPKDAYDKCEGIFL